ncbi:MAG: CoA-binding protein [Candidatus Phosphoribacter sp.]|nr:CoA-binding protein [Actinomycetales bacterium]
MTAHRNDPGVIARVLTTPATWAVVGLSDNRARTAYSIAGFLDRDLGMRVIPIHPHAPFQPPVLGSSGYAALAAVPDGERVDVVDCFVRSALVGAVIDEVIAERERLGIQAIWLQLGVIDEAAARAARAAGLDVVMDTCPKIEISGVRRR